MAVCTSVPASSLQTFIGQPPSVTYHTTDAKKGLRGLRRHNIGWQLWNAWFWLQSWRPRHANVLILPILVNTRANKKLFENVVHFLSLNLNKLQRPYDKSYHTL